MNKVSAPLVVAIWGVLNAALAIVLAGFGGETFELAAYFSSAGLTFLVALTVLLARRYPVKYRSYAQPAHAGGVIFAAAGFLLVCLGLAFGWWLSILAVVPFAVAIGWAVRTRRGAI